MDSAPLIGAYQRYKAGTEKLIQWLFDSASACGPAAPSNRPRSKPKTQPAKRVRTDELIPLAQKIIAAKDPTIDIPLKVLDCTRDAIKGRQQSALWYADKGDLMSNSTHRHFLTILEEIFEMLKREVKSRRPKRKKKIELATDSADLSNLFLHLELEDPSIGTDEADTFDKPKRSAKAQQPVELKMSEEDLENERRFSIWCLMDDLHKIRIHVRGVWMQYKDGDLSLQTTCEITDRAIYIICEIRDDFLNANPTLDSWRNILCCIGLDRYIRNARGIAPWVCSSKDHEHEGPSTTCHFDRLCMPAWCALEEFERLVCWIKYQQPFDSPGDRPVCAFTAHPFARALLDITADLVQLAPSRRSECPIFDRYTELLLRMIDEDQTYGPHNLVATQIYMDVWDVLESCPERALLEANATIEQGAETTRNFSEFSKACSSVSTKSEIRMDVTGGPIAKPCHRCKVHQTQKDRTGWTYQASESQSPVFIPSNVLATLPVFCGVTAFRERIDLTIHGSRLCDANQFTLAAAHLYRAAIVQGSLNTRWDDMEFVISRQNSRDRFVGDMEGQECVNFVARQYCLALGMNVT
ncbi:uncharacterized protein RCC_03687 [Ramularia collo-cygni]|uniref:DUF6604 domain-containing protein n=1 Tax=Ramularia collo-cygni TaxID=112498 RepID=A0A2D3UQA5_9PEZI|nr:uncharacterized protein RCC_03687 [Ramularia collo-cygni]CZT17851.1 uncharacterized protein RCC_03687 [Ramularia collo-cygni]